GVGGMGVGGAVGVSIMQSQISGACCIRLAAAPGESGVTVVLYMDTRGREARPRAGSVEIANALASVGGACLGRLSATELEQRRASLELELRSARVLQEQLLPPAKGSALGGLLRYALLSLPGRVVAGDIVDLMELGGQRVAVVLGDVMGKGAAAGMLMSAVQARLSQGLLDGVPMGELLDRVNKDTCARCPGMMVSLWVGVVDLGERRLSYVDAGHGMALHRRTGDGEGVSELVSGGGLVLGGAEDSVYEVASVELKEGDRVLLFTDGIPEQPDLKGIEFGVERVRECFRRPLAGLDHLPDLHATMLTHANGAVQRDDITAIVLEFVG
ncbi:MAG: SpoIIE family protein phosphatase, partial [Phycisphaerales bacterium]|nr:SpoIIE family protein phosphatase [Phycisphaerales bacterium]